MNKTILLLPLLMACGRTEAKWLDVELVPVVVAPQPDRWVQIDVGPFGHCVRSEYGRVECDGDVVLVEAGARDVSVGGLGVWSGASWGCALLEGDEVVCAMSELAAPPGELTRMPMPTGTRKISVGYQTGCALTDGGQVWCSRGYGLSGPLHEVTGLRGASAISCGYWACCGIIGGSVSCATLVDVSDGETRATPVRLARTATSVSVGMWHACALLDDGSSQCWGDEAARVTPQVGALELSAGMQSTCVLDERRRVVCTGGEIESPFDEPVRSFESFGEVCAITEQGDVRCSPRAGW